MMQCCTNKYDQMCLLTNLLTVSPVSDRFLTFNLNHQSIITTSVISLPLISAITVNTTVYGRFTDVSVLRRIRQDIGHLEKVTAKCYIVEASV